MFFHQNLEGSVKNSLRFWKEGAAALNHEQLGNAAVSDSEESRQKLIHDSAQVLAGIVWSGRPLIQLTVEDYIFILNINKMYTAFFRKIFFIFRGNITPHYVMLLRISHLRSSSYMLPRHCVPLRNT